MINMIGEEESRLMRCDSHSDSLSIYCVPARMYSIILSLETPRFKISIWSRGFSGGYEEDSKQLDLLSSKWLEITLVY
jgi:hypothetical protein